MELGRVSEVYEEGKFGTSIQVDTRIEFDRPRLPFPFRRTYPRIMASALLSLLNGTEIRARW